MARTRHAAAYRFEGYDVVLNKVVGLEAAVTPAQGRGVSAMDEAFLLAATSWCPS